MWKELLRLSRRINDDLGCPGALNTTRLFFLKLISAHITLSASLLHQRATDKIARTGTFQWCSTRILEVLMTIKIATFLWLLILQLVSMVIKLV